MFNLIGNIISGFFVGLIARAIYWGDNDMGFWMTSLLGIGGALIAGLLGSLSSGQGVREGFNRAGCISSIVGALVLIFIGNRMGWHL